MSDIVDTNGSPNSNNQAQWGAEGYLRAAAEADSAGDKTLALHLYLTAFEKSAAAGESLSEGAINGLKQAWRLACETKERSLAEHIFEKMEPFLSHGELAVCADQLQDLALDRLEEIGLSREDLAEMSEMISNDILGGDMPKVKVGHFTGPIHLRRPHVGSGEGESDGPRAIGVIEAGISCGGDCECDGACTSHEGSGKAQDPGESEQGADIEFVEAPETFQDIHGFATAIKVARNMGIGRENDPDYQELMQELNRRHGLPHRPAPDTIVFRAPVREDAREFMLAAAGEIGAGCIRMRVEESPQGIPLLCVYADKQRSFRYNIKTGQFSGSGVLILEDIDLWDLPPMEAEEGIAGFIIAQLSHGAREAISLIHAAARDPRVHVFASCAADGQIEPLFLDLMEPCQVVDIEMPTPGERADIWLDIAHRHPSLRQIDRTALVRYSANLPRCDIYLAAREAVEESYKAGLAQRRYVPVEPAQLYEKIAAYQPLESDEYRALEDEIVRDFQRDMEDLDELLS